MLSQAEWGRAHPPEHSGQGSGDLDLNSLCDTDRHFTQLRRHAKCLEEAPQKPCRILGSTFYQQPSRAESLVAAGLLPLLCPTPGIFLNPINDLWVVESRDRWSLVCFHTSLALNCTSIILVLVITTNTSMRRSLASASSKSSSSKLPEHVLSDYFPACLSCPQQITSGGILISSATGATWDL